MMMGDKKLNAYTFTKKNRYARHKISELQLSLRSILSRWSDVSVPEMKAV
jgi:hypothetical protein